MPKNAFDGPDEEENGFADNPEDTGFRNLRIDRRVAFQFPHKGIQHGGKNVNFRSRFS